MERPDFYVSGYAGADHPAVSRREARVGDLLVKTWHIGAPSKDAEVAAWRSRMARGEVSKIVVEDVAAGIMETIDVPLFLPVQRRKLRPYE